ncbi:MAG: N-acetylmuramoyl-L-alanine amidase family 2 [Acidimicrobiales bacterium]|nr:N-acetylmuramoyl-L-alanine amidase family 2 [Acidimicrobiales bacterium]
MCDACTPTFNRRSLLRGAAIGGVAAATGTLWMPNLVGRAAAAGDSSGSSMESASMAEDGTLSSHAKLSNSSVAATRVIPALNTKGVKAPPIMSRAQWKANEAIRLDSRAYAPIRKLIVHHTASANKPANPAAVVREVLAFHASGRGFSDTGYNFMIDHRGVIYEGRAARRYTPDEVITGEDTKGWGVVGAHAKGYNAGSCGVCLIGDFDTAAPTDAALNSLVWLLAWKACRHRIDANGKDDYFDIYGGHHVFANITGHRQVGQTLCPGSKLFAVLPAIREEVERSACRWQPLVVDTPGVLRYEWGSLRAAGASGTTDAPTTTTTTPAAPSTSMSTTPADATVTTAIVTTDSAPRTTGAKLSGIRVTSNAGTIYTAGKARKLGNPATSGITKVVALANASTGDGYWALGENGSVAAFGGLSHYGDATGKGSAVDIAATSTGVGYWVLMADGGIYPFGDARYSSSPKRAGVNARAARIAPRPQSDGYWVVAVDGTITAFGAAPKLGVPTGSGTPIDLAVTPTGAGYWVLTDTGRVLAVGDAVDKGDLQRSKVKWRKPVAHVVGTPSGKGYVIVNSEGSMLAFGDAPAYPSFGGSGITVAGVALAFT